MAARVSIGNAGKNCGEPRDPGELRSEFAHAPEHAVDLRSLYGAADAALYAAKRAGRNQVATPSNEVVALMRG